MRISYGKLRVPVHRIERDELFACEISVEVLGENFAAAYTEGDNSNVVATDTMKNFVLREALQFEGTTLDPKWAVVNPVPGSTPTVANGHLRLPIVPGDLYGGDGNAQLILQQSLPGSWVATAKIRHAAIDRDGEAALAATLGIFEEDGLSVDFGLEPGQIQFVDNRAIGHSRTAFIDDPDPARRRHLVRLWLRDHGRRAYTG